MLLVMVNKLSLQMSELKACFNSHYGTGTDTFLEKYSIDLPISTIENLYILENKVMQDESCRAELVHIYI